MGPNLRILEIPLADLAHVHQLPDHVRQRWASWESTDNNRTEVAIEDIEARLIKAEKKREEFRMWVTDKAKARPRRQTDDDDEERVLNLKRLEEKLAAAQLNRERELEAVRSKAANLAASRNNALAKRSELAEAAAQKLEGNLKAAEDRRLARIEAAKERLSAAHELVHSRMTSTMENEKRSTSEKRRRINSRMRKADELRKEQLAAVSKQAGETVERAKEVSRLARINTEQEARMKRSNISHRLDAAAERRMRKRHILLQAGESGEELGETERLRLEELAASLRARKLQKVWRTFVRKRKTTAALAQVFAATGIPRLNGVTSAASAAAESAAEAARNAQDEEVSGVVMMGGMSGGQSPRHIEFESFASTLQSPATLRAAQALLRRLEIRLHAKGVADASCNSLLRRLFPKAPNTACIERYPSRVFLCAYMIIQHPEVVFSSLGEREATLSQAAQEMVTSFEQLLDRILQPLPSSSTASSSSSTPLDSPRGGSGTPSAMCPSPLRMGMEAYRDAFKKGPLGEGGEEATQLCVTVAQMLVKFDEVWLSYLDQFVAWKSADAASLESELVRMAVQLEVSLRRKLGGQGEESERVRNSSDLQAMVAQVAHDHQLLRERVQKLTGARGLERLEEALTTARELVVSESDSEWETDRSNPPSRRPSTSGSNSGLASPSRSQAASRSSSQALELPPQVVAAAQANVDPAEQRHSNEQMVWELMYNPSFRLPSDEADGAWQRAVHPDAPEPSVDEEEMNQLALEDVMGLIRRRAVAVAERAFWDSVRDALLRGLQQGDLSAELVPLLSELAADLASALPEGPSSEDVRQRFSQEMIMQQLRNGESSGNSIMRVMEMLQQLSNLLISSGSAAREEEARGAQQRMAEQLYAAAQAQGPDTPTLLVSAIIPSLRLMFAQIKLLKLDTANTRLSLLAHALQSQGAANYLQTKFSAQYSLPPASDAPSAATLAPLLPRTAAWAQSVIADLPVVEQRLQSLGITVSVLEGVSRGGPPSPGRGGSGVPLGPIRTGIRSTGASPGRISSDGGLPVGMDQLKVSYPVQLRGWRGALRAGLVGFAASEVAAVEALPETLDGQGERVHAAQNRFQQLLVTTAGLLIAQQVRQRASLTPLTPLERQHAKRRVMALLCDPSMRLDLLMALLTQIAGVNTPQEEAQIKGAFRTVVTPGSVAYRAISTTLLGTLICRLMLGAEGLAASGEVGRAVQSALERSGAAVVSEEIEALANDIALMAAAGEAVHGRLYQQLLTT